jgi:hypothetical protein
MLFKKKRVHIYKSHIVLFPPGISDRDVNIHWYIAVTRPMLVKAESWNFLTKRYSA